MKLHGTGHMQNVKREVFHGETRQQCCQSCANAPTTRVDDSLYGVARASSNFLRVYSVMSCHLASST